MSATSTMDANPYSAPDAELGRGDDDVYQPSIFSFSGRIGRLRYIAYSIGMMFLMSLAMYPLVGVLAVTGGAESISLITIVALSVFYIALIVLSVMFGKRRLNDLNRSGWWLFLNLVPLANFALAIYMLFFPGTDGSNNWGAAPAANSLGVKILGWSMPVLMLVGIVAAIVIPMVAGVPGQ